MSSEHNDNVFMPPPGRSDLPAALPSFAQLPPKAARLCLRVEKHLRGLRVRPGDHLVAAVSGGADSTALACLLALLAPRLEVAVSFVVCDHGLRPESAAEADFVEALGRLLKVRTLRFSLHLDSQATGIEEKSRAARYAVLKQAMREEEADWLVLAHHAGDLREDMILRLLRGTGWPGLGGMQEKDTERRLLRPLLDLEPQSLRDFLTMLAIPHCEDPSNQDTRYARNRVRHEIMPRLRQENPNLDRVLLDLARLARVDAEFFEREVEQVLAECRLTDDENGISLFLPIQDLAENPRAVRLRVYMAMVRELARKGAAGQARAETLFQLDQALENRQWPKTFQLPGGMCFTLDKKGLFCTATRMRAD